MSFNDDDVKNLFVPDDAHQQDLSFFKVDCEEGFRGYIVNGTPGRFHFWKFILHSVNSSKYSCQLVKVSASHTLASTFFGGYVVKMTRQSCGMLGISGLCLIQMAVFLGP